MGNIEINEFFMNEYLICGRTRDNFIFENCLVEIINVAKECLSESSDSVKSCVISISKREEQGVEKIIEKCSNDLQRKIVARDFVCLLILRETLRGVHVEAERFMELENMLSIFMGASFEKYKENHNFCPMPLEISGAVRKYGKIELNIFLVDTKNVLIQQAINNFVSSREPYSVKIFTTNEKLPTYLDQMGNKVEWPHDYMTIDISNYVTFVKEDGCLEAE